MSRPDRIDICEWLRTSPDPRGKEAADLIETLRATVALCQRRNRMAGKKIKAMSERLAAIDADRERRKRARAA